MNDNKHILAQTPHWFAIKTPKDFAAEAFFKDKCDDVFFPKEYVATENKKQRVRAVIPHVLFIKTTKENALSLEEFGRKHPEQSIPFWIYRFPKVNEIQVIPEISVELLRLLTSDDTSRCRIYTGHEFKENQRVRVTGGIYKGYEGYVQRIQKNKHVIVKIEGICMVILPFIHPDLLEKIEDND